MIQSDGIIEIDYKGNELIKTYGLDSKGDMCIYSLPVSRIEVDKDGKMIPIEGNIIPLNFIRLGKPNE